MIPRITSPVRHMMRAEVRAEPDGKKSAVISFNNDGPDFQPTSRWVLSPDDAEQWLDALSGVVARLRAEGESR